MGGEGQILERKKGGGGGGWEEHHSDIGAVGYLGDMRTRGAGEGGGATELADPCMHACMHGLLLAGETDSPLKSRPMTCHEHET